MRAAVQILIICCVLSRLAGQLRVEAALRVSIPAAISHAAPTPCKQSAGSCSQPAFAGSGFTPCALPCCMKSFEFQMSWGFVLWKQPLRLLYMHCMLPLLSAFLVITAPDLARPIYCRRWSDARALHCVLADIVRGCLRQLSICANRSPGQSRAPCHLSS